MNTPKFAPGTRVRIAKIGKTKTVVQAHDYGGEWAYRLVEEDGTFDEGWREDELTLSLKPMKPSLVRKTVAQTDKLIELETQKIATLKELKRSLLLALVAPDVWMGGKVTTKVEGDTHYSYSMSREVPTRRTEFVVRRDGEEIARRKLYEVPTELWPDDMLARALSGFDRTKVREIVEAEKKETADVA